MKWNNQGTISPREEKIRETAAACKESYFRQEQNRLLTWWEFLWTQLQYTRKRWWALQAALLLFAMQMIPWMEDAFAQLRTMGVIGCLFVVLMIPELWRNRENDAIQVEASCLYALRQIYAARITLFGMVDVALLTLCSLGLGRQGFSLVEVMSHLLLPATVTASICFFLLCGNANFSETVSRAACLIFGGAWWLLLMNEQIYMRIVPAVWTSLFGLALLMLALAIRRTLQTTNRYWEVDYFGITTG